MDTKEKLNLAFKNLRKNGMIARQRYLCCGSCATSAIARDVKRANSTGYVYYTRQDWESSRDGDAIYLGFGTCGSRGISAEQIGAEIFVELQKAGLRTEWSGDVTERILVHLN